MDSSISKFLEDDEDQTMHPEAAVKAFIPTLNSNIEGNNNSKSQPHTRTDDSIADAMKVPFGLLLSIIEPQLDKDRAISLRCLYNRLKSNNINRNEFIRNIRTLVGKDMIKTALYKLQTQQMMQGPIHPNVAHEKPLEFSPSKKQKVCGAYSDQSIEQLDDVTSVSGVNLREEEEQLFSGSISQVSESSRKVVQEEERRLFLQRLPLQKKVAEIMAKCGVKNKSNGVERCLSWCVEERMHGLITNLIRLSKQRLDIEKPRHQTVITSDIGQQIMLLNRKAREEYEEKQPEVSGGDGDGKSSKVNKKKADKMRTAAAHVAARMAVGGDDMLSKWQQQARKKRENGPTIRKSVRNRDLCQSGDNIQLPRAISLKDVISVLEREIQMSKSTLIYDLLCRSSFRFHV